MGSAEIGKRASGGKGVRKRETDVVMNPGIPGPIRCSGSAGRRAVPTG